MWRARIALSFCGLLTVRAWAGGPAVAERAFGVSPQERVRATATLEVTTGSELRVHLSGIGTDGTPFSVCAVQDGCRIDLPECSACGNCARCSSAPVHGLDATTFAGLAGTGSWLPFHGFDVAIGTAIGFQGPVTVFAGCSLHPATACSINSDCGADGPCVPAPREQVSGTCDRDGRTACTDAFDCAGGPCVVRRRTFDVTLGRTARDVDLPPFEMVTTNPDCRILPRVQAERLRTFGGYALVGAATLGDVLLFGACSGSLNLFDAECQLWRTDGSAGGTTLVKTINPNRESALYGEMVALGSRVLFGACSGVRGLSADDCELWQTDGTDGGTTRVADIAPGTMSSLPGSFVVLGSSAFFSACSAGVFGVGESDCELWRSDGTSAGTERVADILPGLQSGLASIPVVVASRLFFQGCSEPGFPGDCELWSSDGTTAGTTRLIDLLPGPESSNPSDLTAVGNALFFTACTDKCALWRTDGTADGTVQVGAFPSGPLAALGSTLFFTSCSGVVDGFLTDCELWRSDGTVPGTFQVADIFPGEGSSSPNGFEAAGSLLFFEACDDDDELVGGAYCGLWRTDGTALGTLRLARVQRGAANPHVVGSSVFFRGCDDAHSCELWQTDGTTAGTVRVADVGPCGVDSDILGPVDFRGTALFAASPVTSFGPVRNELWTVLASCGDGTLNPGEQCDDGARNGAVDCCCTFVCTFVSAGTACEDGDLCTSSDGCQAGACVGASAVSCDDGNACTTDGCHPARGCFHADNSAACDDGDLCTTDICAEGVCHGTPKTCTDTNLCDGTQSCDPSTGQCLDVASPDCNDRNPCTDDTCDDAAPDQATACQHTNNEIPCDDADACTTGDTCRGGSCSGETEISCDDHEVCTADSCDHRTGCRTVPLTGPPCPGGSCVAGTCVSTAGPCKTVRCTVDRRISGPCAGSPLPRSLRNKLNKAIALLDGGNRSSGKRRKAVMLLKQVNEGVQKDARKRRPKIPSACSAAFQSTIDGVLAEIGRL